LPCVYLNLKEFIRREHLGVVYCWHQRKIINDSKKPSGFDTPNSFANLIKATATSTNGNAAQIHRTCN
jgi:hypothetical protein